MTKRFRTLFLMACAAASLGCGSDQGVGLESDDHKTGGGDPTHSLAVVQIKPYILGVSPGDTLQLTVVIYYKDGRPMSLPGSVTYASDAPEIATVSSTGLVTGVAVGVARITATAVVGPATQKGFAQTHVLGPAPDELELTADAEGGKGWQPAVSQVKAGGVVQWTAEPTNWSGRPHTSVSFWYAPHGSYFDREGDLDFDLTGGSTTYIFETPGTVGYCSGGCNDQRDFGTIFVR